MDDAEKELRRQKRKKFLRYFAVFIVFQVFVFTVLGLTVLRVRSPKIRLEYVTIFNSNFKTGSSPSFNFSMLAEVSVKNRNWGEYKFSESTMVISYQGLPVGEAPFPAGKAKARSTRRLTVKVDVNSNSLLENSNLGYDLNSGLITLTSYTKLRGKATLMYLMKRKKSGEMECVLIISTTTRRLQDLRCK